jgi:hypothetical protein
MASYLREKGLGKKEGKEENSVCVEESEKK